jgi:hypothetical protein
MCTPFIRFILIACAVLFTAVGHCEITPPEVPIETKDLTMTRAQIGGQLLVRPCKDCAMLSLQLDANSKAFFNGKPVSISSIPEHSSSAITVIYDPSTKVVKRVRW